MLKAKNKKKFLSLLVAAMMTVGLSTSLTARADENTTKTNPNTKVIDIISFNDFHGALESDGKKTPGMSKFVGAIKEYKKANPNTIVVSGGDNYQGTAMSNLTYGKPVSDMFKEIGLTASAIGNHEYDWGTDYIETWQKDGGFEFLACNIYDKKTNEPITYAKPYKMVEMDGVKIGFIGLSTPETQFKTKPENVAGLEFRDPVKAATEWANKLKAGSVPEGKADVVIALTHLGAAQASSDKTITGEATDLTKIESIDGIIAGHTHNQVAGEVNGKPIIEGYYSGRTLANLKMTFDKDSNKLISIDPMADTLYERKDTLKDDENALKIYNEYKEKLGPVLNEVVGITDIELSHDRFNHKGTSPLGYWTCDVMRKEVGAQIGITNGGGLRTSIPKGDITMGKLYEVMPFDNTLVTMKITGAQLKQAIEHGIYNEKYGWVQVAGVKVYYDSNKEAGNRISDMFLDDGTKIEMDKLYTVVTNDFMSTGGDEYDFSGAIDMHDTNMPIRDALVKSLKALNGKHLAFNYSDPLINGKAPETEKPEPEKPEVDKPELEKPEVEVPVVEENKNTESVKKLPQTGSVASTESVAAVGTIMIIIGLAVVIDKKKKNVI